MGTQDPPQLSLSDQPDSEQLCTCPEGLFLSDERDPDICEFRKLCELPSLQTRYVWGLIGRRDLPDFRVWRIFCKDHMRPLSISVADALLEN